MASGSSQPPVIAIVGETASGKSALAMELAQRFNGEIIAADSRTVYKGMDIGTAKPTAEDQALVRHHLLDVVAPDESFSAAVFKAQAEAAIADITGRGKLPFIVGGTGLYVDSVMYDFSFRKPADPILRAELEGKTVNELQALLVEQDIALPENKLNPRHLIRTLETGGELPTRGMLRTHGLILGLAIDRERLLENLRLRVDAMVKAGFIDEVRRLVDQYGWEAPGMQAPGYKAFRSYIDGLCTLKDAKAQFVQNDLRLAKRQRTWFRRNTDIHYICKKEEAEDLITTLLNNCYTASD